MKYLHAFSFGLRSMVLGLLAVSLLVATGCATTGQDIETALRENMPKTCALIQTGHDAFVIATETGKIDPDLIAREKAAYDGIQVFCENPSGVTLANAPILVARAYVTITFALDTARKAGVENGRST